MSSERVANDQPQHEIKYLKDYQPPIYFIPSIKLHLKLDAKKTMVHSQMQFKKRASAEENASLFLHGENIDLIDIRLDGQKLELGDYTIDHKGLEIFKVPSQGLLEITNSICPETNESLEGLYESNGMLCTQCEPEGFRKITFFVDRPDNMSLFEVRLEGKKSQYPFLLSNGNLHSKGDLDNGLHFAQWVDPFPKPSYLFAVVGCDLAVKKDEFITQSGRKVEIAFYVEPSDVDKVDYAITALKKSMKWDEARYGCEYDLEIYMVVAVSHFNMGAMENKGLNIFNTKCVLASPDTATDQQYANVEGIIAHEYFHNYSGNRVTCANWFQLSLKEGFTVFRDQQFSMEVDSWLAHRIAAVKTIRTIQFAQDAGPMAHPVRPPQYIEMNNFYTVTVYDKGAEVIRMLHTLLGDDQFIRGAKNYFKRYDGQAVTIEDFLSAMTENTGFSTQVFQRWYEQAGTPHVLFVQEYNPATQVYKLGFEQSYTRFETHQSVAIPIRMGLIDSKTGEPIQLKTDHSGFQLTDQLEREGTEGVFLLDKQQDLIEFHGVSQAVVPSLFRGFSAPVYCEGELSNDDYYLLMSFDTDAFNRWDSAQYLMNQEILHLGALAVQELPMPVNQKLVDAWLSIYTNEAISAEERALTCTLPSYASTAEFQFEQIGIILVENLMLGFKKFQKHIALACHQTIYKIYNETAALLQQTPYSPSAEDAGLRSLKNLSLALLASVAQDIAHIDIESCLYHQFQTADNITDRLCALRLLVHEGFDRSRDALDLYEKKWSTHQLAMDHWFDIQASNPNQEVLKTIHQLKAHRLYDVKSPNNVRALIGSFVNHNIKMFHDLKGEGYTFLADEVIYFNQHNPQLAARLFAPLTQWKRYDGLRSLKLKKEIERILKIDKISPDLYEVASSAAAQ